MSGIASEGAVPAIVAAQIRQWKKYLARVGNHGRMETRAGERMGCTEALFSLGDKPELLFPEMRDTLRRLGYKSTLHYLEAMCDKVLRESSLLPLPILG